MRRPRATLTLFFMAAHGGLRASSLLWGVTRPRGPIGFALGPFVGGQNNQCQDMVILSGRTTQVGTQRRVR